MKENLKIGLLAIIAITLIANIIMQKSGSWTEEAPGSSESATASIEPLNAQGGQDLQNKDLNMAPFDNQNPAAPAVNTGPTTSIAFAKSAYDFGKVKQDSKNKYKFKFTNTGSNPLIIENASGSCGCTVPEYPKEPIPPGGAGEITVEYSPGKQQGAQSKTVTITANTEPKQTILTISANVEVATL